MWIHKNSTGNIGVIIDRCRDEAQKAIQMLDDYEVRPGKFIGVCLSLDNCRLFVGSIPKDKRKEEVLEEMKKVKAPHNT